MSKCGWKWIVEPGCHFDSIINLGRTKLDFTEGQAMKDMKNCSLRVNVMFIVENSAQGP